MVEQKRLVFGWGVFVCGGRRQWSYSALSKRHRDYLSFHWQTIIHQVRNEARLRTRTHPAQNEGVWAKRWCIVIVCSQHKNVCVSVSRESHRRVLVGSGKQCHCPPGHVFHGLFSIHIFTIYIWLELSWKVYFIQASEHLHVIKCRAYK